MTLNTIATKHKYLDAKLNSEKVELLFQFLASNKNLIVSKPSSESQAYDFITDGKSVLNKIQVKCSRNVNKTGSYTVVTHRGGYSKDIRNNRVYGNSIDYFALYLQQDDIWYIIPSNIINTLSIHINPKNQNCKYAAYKDAWHLLGV